MKDEQKTKPQLIEELVKARRQIAGLKDAQTWGNQGDEARRKAEGLLGVILRSISDAVIVTDAEGLVSFMNPTAENLTGWDSEEAVRRPMDEIFVIRNTVGLP